MPRWLGWPTDRGIGGVSGSSGRNSSCSGGGGVVTDAQVRTLTAPATTSLAILLDAFDAVAGATPPTAHALSTAILRAAARVSTSSAGRAAGACQVAGVESVGTAAAESDVGAFPALRNFLQGHSARVVAVNPVRERSRRRSFPRREVHSVLLDVFDVPTSLRWWGASRW